MATTYTQLVSDISAMLHGWTGYQEQATWLVSSMNNSDLVMTLNDASQLKVGIAEVDDELLYVSTVSDSATVNLAPFGRGYMGTSAASHSINAKVTNHPIFPRAQIKQAIKECISALFPMLFQIKATNFSYQANLVTYPLPADVYDILTVEWLRSDASNFWEPMLEWDLEEDSDATLGALAVKQLSLLEPAFQGATVRAVYMADFGVLTSDSDTLTSIGLEDSATDMIKYCVAAKLIRSKDFTRIQTTNVENYARAQHVAVGDAYKVAAAWDQAYQQRLYFEREKLINRYPPRPNFSR